MKFIIQPRVSSNEPGAGGGGATCSGYGICQELNLCPSNCATNCNVLAVPCFFVA